MSTTTPSRRGTVAVLGTGSMGGPIARNLLAAGFDVHAWNRSRAKAEPLAAAGAPIAGDPAEAVADAQVVITMLADGRAVEETMLDPGGALAAMPRGAVWIQCRSRRGRQPPQARDQHLARRAGGGGR